MGRTRLSPQQQEMYVEGYRQGVAATHEASIRRAAEALLLREAAEIAASVASKGPEKALEALGVLVGGVLTPRWILRLSDVLEAVMVDAVAVREPILGVGFTLANPFMERYFREYVDRIAGEITDTTRRHVEAKIQEALERNLDPTAASDLVSQALRAEAPQRAQGIARIELNRAVKGANYLQAAESGYVLNKTHIHQDDDRVRIEHRFTETVPVHEPYQNGEYWAGQFSINCRCKDEYEFNLDAL